MPAKATALWAVESRIGGRPVATTTIPSIVVLRSREYIWNRQRQRGGGRNSDFPSSSARCAAVKNRLGGNFIERELRLQVGAPLVKASDDRENDSRSKHQPGEKGKVLIRTDLFSATGMQDPFIYEADEKFA